MDTDRRKDLLQAFRDQKVSCDGFLTPEALQQLLSRLDSSGFWTPDKVDVVLDAVGRAVDGRVDATKFVTYVCGGGRNYEEIRKKLASVMDSADWDDGSYAPLLIRLAWHSSGTYDAASGTGGSNGATMRHAVEAADPENAGLEKAREYLEQVKAEHPWVSYADLWILAACVAIEHTGGPSVPFHGGRFDGPAEKAVKPGRLPGAETGLDAGFELDEEGRLRGWERLAGHVREVFQRMGFCDQEMVALICGGHLYGRCHPTSSGYAGAWVENPTLFSNEYAADLIGDKWVAVQHDTRMPDGGVVPEEVRPAPGKRQYIDLSKYMPDEEDQQVRAAPDADGHPPGRYRCVSQWVNCRESADVDSSIVGRVIQGTGVDLVTVKVFGTAVRGLALCGGWVSIVGSGGKTLFQREGGFQLDTMAGRFRSVAPGGALCYATCAGGDTSGGRCGMNEEFCVVEVAIPQGGELAGALLGRVGQDAEGVTSRDYPWVLLHAPSLGLCCEWIMPGYNEKPRRPLAGQTGHQMMLASDMVLLWDPDFRKHLEIYAEDESQLKIDFGAAFLRLTELGCPWSSDRGTNGNGCPVSGASAQVGQPLGCPIMAGM